MERAQCFVAFTIETTMMTMMIAIATPMMILICERAAFSRQMRAKNGESHLHIFPPKFEGISAANIV